MKKDSHELEEMFAVDLEPSKKFEKQLRSKLTASKKPKFLPWKRIAMVGSALAVVAVLALSLYRPATGPQNNGQQGPTQNARNILVSQLYQKALAAPESSEITFWQIESEFGGGPKAEACTNRSAEGLGATSNDRNTHQKELELLYRKDNITAVLEKMLDDGGLGTNAAYFEPYMAYSEDASKPAFDDKYFFGNVFQPFIELKDEVVLTDKDGNPLSVDAVVAEKDSGTYDLYSKVSTQNLPGGYGNCEELLGHLVVDAKSNMLVSAKAYVNDMSDANLVWFLEREIQTGSGDFASVEQIFVKNGFDKQQAKETVQNMPN